MSVSEKMMDDSFKMPKTNLTNFSIIFESVTILIGESQDGESRGPGYISQKGRP